MLQALTHPKNCRVERRQSEEESRQQSEIERLLTATVSDYSKSRELDELLGTAKHKASITAILEPETHTTPKSLAMVRCVRAYGAWICQCPDCKRERGEEAPGSRLELVCGVAAGDSAAS